MIAVKKKNWYERWWIYVIFFVTTVILIPLIINIFFKIQSPCYLFSAEWSAGEFLGFYGTVLGAVVTIVAIITTIKITKKQNEIQHKHFIAEYRKNLIDDKYEKIFAQLQLIKEVILLEVLKDDNFWDKLTHRAFNNYFDKVVQCIKYLRTVKKTDDQTEQDFVQFSSAILQMILEKYADFCQKALDAQNDLTNYNIEKKNYEDKQRGLNSTPESKMRKIQMQLSNIEQTPDNEFSNKQPKTVDEIRDECIALLNQNKMEYEKAYVEMFNKYIEWKSVQKLEEVKHLID